MPARRLGSRVLARQVYGITSTDIPALATVFAVLLIVGAIAAIGPLRRLLSIDPAAAMRAI
jgi:ABC-type antimicrobial peptide transport system permease subunit